MIARLRHGELLRHGDPPRRRGGDGVRHPGDYPNVDGVVAFAHGTGCGMAAEGPGFDNLQRVLWGHATHPNVGRGGLRRPRLRGDAGRPHEGRFGTTDADRFHGLTIQDTGGTTKTVAMIVDRDPRPPAGSEQGAPRDRARLRARLALQCGGSDGFSGITANPALGAASDLLVGMGGTAILSETPEIYGAEQLLLRRAASPEVAEKLVERIRWWENYTAINGGSMDNNPSPGNKAGGLTTILEKSLGAAAKGGATPLTAVYQYAETVTEPGFVFMDTPGYDPVSATGQIAAGAQVVVFTTGRGSAFGSKPAPTIKVATSAGSTPRCPTTWTSTAATSSAQASRSQEKGAEFWTRSSRVASGEKTKSEALGLGDNEFVPWQIGAVM